MKNNSNVWKLPITSLLLATLITITCMNLMYGSTAAYAGGTGWSVVASPNPSRTNNALQAITALSTNNVWAVGSSLKGSTKSTLVQQTLIERYDGSTWQVVASPNVGTGDNALTGVAAISPQNVWAVGSSALGALVLHFNGLEWKLFATPSTCHLNAVTATSANDVWAVGTTSVQSCAEHFNGNRWSLVSTPFIGTSDNVLLGVSARTAQDVWAVGTYCAGTGCGLGGGRFQTLLLHFDGYRWSVVPSPNPSSYANQLNAVTIISATDAWAVGGYKLDPMTGSSMIVHFDGISWTQVVSPNGNGTTSLTAIAAASPISMYAVGTVYMPATKSNATVIEQFDGTTWSIVNSPSPGKDSGLSGLVHVPAAPFGTAQFWGVGGYSTDISGNTLVERDI